MRFLHHQFQPRGVRCPHLTQDLRYAIAITLLVLALCSPLLADTTWVAGEVWGTWTREGNPYLVTDTLIVPLDSTLNIQPGVQIWFLDQEIRRTPIYVYGRLRAIAEEADSIYFYSPVAGFGQILGNAGSEIRLVHCVVDSSAESFDSYSGHVVLLHSRIRASGIMLDMEADTVMYCGPEMPYVLMEYGGPSVYQHNRGLGISAALQQMRPIFGNQISDIQLFMCSWTEVYDNEMVDADLDLTDGYWHHNLIEGWMQLFDCSLLAESNEIGGGDSLTIDVLTMHDCRSIIRQNRINGWIQDSDPDSAIYYKNLICSPWWGMDVGPADYCLIQGNTIAFEGYGVSAYGQTIQIVDNIFMGRVFEDYGVRVGTSTTEIISYNDFFNVTIPTYECELDTGNLWLNPEFCGGDPFDYYLQASSPCIDAGNPASPLDPDGTRADMGALFFDHRLDHPPALYSPLESTVQVGTEFRYVARATDDYGPLEFGFWDLPPWLNIENLDWVADSAVVSGIVPLDQENFTFGIWVEDGLSQRDSQEVSVIISDMTVLAGVVTGVLTAEQSPYFVAENIVVPAGDSLHIEPGVEIRFRHDAYPSQPNLIVRGTLNAVGTAEDSIRFLPQFQDTTSMNWGGIWFRGYSADTSRVEYAYLYAPYYAIEADSQAAVVLKHLVIDPGWGSRVLNDSWVSIDSCFFYSSAVSVFVRDATAVITNSYSLCPNGNPGVHLDFFSNARGTVQGCTFVDGYSCDFDDLSWVDFRDNTLFNLQEGLVVYNEASGIFANNRFTTGSGMHIAYADSLLITNNTFYHTTIGIDILHSALQTTVANNLFFRDSVAMQCRSMSVPFTDIRYNDFYRNQIDYQNCEPDSTNIFLDPLLQDTIDFRLSLGSPCIDAGDPDPFFNDVDSTRNDIGCWGGPWGESYPYSPVLSHQSKPIPTEFALLPPYPNPFNSVLVISFNLPVEKEVRIGIYNILGQKVQQWTLPPTSPGVHRVIWNSRSCASGIYIVRLMSDGKQFNQKVVLLK